MAYFPVRYNDPTGHLAEGECSFNNLGCELPYETPDISLASLTGSRNDRDNDDKLDPKIYHSPKYPHLYGVIMPQGQLPSQPRNTEELQRGEDLAATGMFMDLAEGGAIASLIDLGIAETVLSGFDVIVTGFSCYGSGECYFGQPHESLPDMLVVNQDVLVTTGDFVLPFAAGGLAGAATEGAGFLPGAIVTDAITTSGSFFYDLGRLNGNVPNFVSVGITPNLDRYILIYPP